VHWVRPVRLWSLAQNIPRASFAPRYDSWTREYVDWKFASVCGFASGFPVTYSCNIYAIALVFTAILSPTFNSHLMNGSSSSSRVQLKGLEILFFCQHENVADLELYLSCVPRAFQWVFPISSWNCICSGTSWTNLQISKKFHLLLDPFHHIL